MQERRRYKFEVGGKVKVSRPRPHILAIELLHQLAAPQGHGYLLSDLSGEANRRLSDNVGDRTDGMIRTRFPTACTTSSTVRSRSRFHPTDLADILKRD